VTDPTSDAATLSTADILRHAQRVRDSGILGRSNRIRGLFDFLVDCAVRGRVPKEIEVAIDGFGRSPAFDASKNALVRVYVHKLRRKLDAFYAAQGEIGAPRLVIPKGEYRLLVDIATPPSSPYAVWRARPSRREWLAIGLLGAAATVALWLGLMRVPSQSVDPQVAATRASALWQSLLQDDLPIQIVLGDYYIFGERDASGQVSRLIRDFNVNSRDDLERRVQTQPALAAQVEDLDLGYLPTSSAYALGQLLPVLAAAGKRTSISLASQLNADVFKSSHVIYIGYISALGMMQDVVFAGSRFAVGASYDELIDVTSGASYVSQAGEPKRNAERYKDYAYVSTFPGPNGNQHLVVAGTRDTAVRQAAEMMVGQRRLDELRQQAKGQKAYEALYEVYGVNRTNIEARLLIVAPLNTASLWTDLATQPDAPAAAAP